MELYTPFIRLILDLREHEIASNEGKTCLYSDSEYSDDSDDDNYSNWAGHKCCSKPTWVCPRDKKYFEALHKLLDRHLKFDDYKECGNNIGGQLREIGRIDDGEANQILKKLLHTVVCLMLEPIVQREKRVIVDDSVVPV